MRISKLDIGRTINTLANLGVIAGIVFLAVELNQNNQLLKMEAQATLSGYMQNGWDRIASDPTLVDLFIKDRNGQQLSESEEMRLNSFWMGYLIRMEWMFEHFPDTFTRGESLRRVHSAYGSFRRTWSGDTDGSRGAGKDNFSREFVAFVDDLVLGET